MKKPINEAFHFQEVAEMFHKLDGESDRAVALIVAAWLDDTLTAMLQRKLVQDEKVITSMFGPMQPLGSFSSRIKLAYLIRRVSRQVFDNLETIRTIRNLFAHSRNDLSFKSESIVKHCGNLRLNGFKLEPIAGERSAGRDAFVATGLALMGFFIEMAGAQTMSEDGDEDYFDNWISWAEKELFQQLRAYMSTTTGGTK